MYCLLASANSGVWVESQVLRRIAAILSGFFTSVARHSFYGRAVWEGETPAGPLVRSLNPHGSAHPHESGEAENSNRLLRSFTMPRASKRASAQAATPSLKLAPVVPIRQSDPVHDESAQDCVDLLRSLLKQAERGELVGLVLIKMLKNKRYGFEFSGMLEQNKTFALGATEVLKARILEGVMAR